MRLSTFGKSFFASLALIAVTSGCGDMNMAPNPPSDLKVMPLSGGAHLTWKDNSDNETQFMIERKVAGQEFQVLKAVDANITQYHDAPITSAMTYTYRVMAMGKAGGHGADAKYSNEVSLTAP